MTRASPAITALATLAIAWFTGTLWQSTAKMQAVTEETLKRIDREFIASHRPTLVVRSFELIKTPTDNPSDFFRFLIKYRIVNIGQSNATLIAVGCDHSTAITSDPFPPNPLAVTDPPPVPPKTIGVGKSLPEGYQNTEAAVWIADNDPALGRNSELRVFGRLVYLDDSGARREMGFCRCYNFENRRFTTANDPDYEYSD